MEACRRGGMEGVLEACYTRSDVEVGELDVCVVWTCKYQGMELWSSGAPLQAYQCGGMKV